MSTTVETKKHLVKDMANSQNLEVKKMKDEKQLNPNEVGKQELADCLYVSMELEKLTKMYSFRLMSAKDYVKACKELKSCL